MPEVLDYRGLRCPQPVLKIAIKAKQVPPGTSLEVQADCPTFAEDSKKWCGDSGKVLVSLVDVGAYTVATVQL